jgi:hypothetical protein
MPVRRRTDKRPADLTEEHESWLHGNDRAAGFVQYAPDDELGALWRAHSDRIVAEHVIIHPGTRPHRWWQHSAPRLPLGTFPGLYFDGKLPEPRRRLGGIGTPASDVLAYVPMFRYGLPWIWIEHWQVMYYSRLAVDIHGAPIGDLYPRNFKGVAIDPNDPPTFESQAAYLKRHGLSLAGEERRSTFQPHEGITPRWRGRRPGR